MSPSDPHAPTPAGPDPDEPTEVRPAPSDPFAPPVAEPAAGDDASLASLAAEPTPTVAPADATPDTPAGTAAPESDWLEPDVGAAAATPEPDPVVRTPDAFTPLGTPEPSGPPPVLQKAQEFAEKPEGKVALAFAGGVVASFLLKKLGR